MGSLIPSAGKLLEQAPQTSQTLAAATPDSPASVPANHGHLFVTLAERPGAWHRIDGMSGATLSLQRCNVINAARRRGLKVQTRVENATVYARVFLSATPGEVR